MRCEEESADGSNTITVTAQSPSGISAADMKVQGRSTDEHADMPVFHPNQKDYRTLEMSSRVNFNGSQVPLRLTLIYKGTYFFVEFI